MPIIDDDLINRAQKAHLIGVGGVGMSALAQVLKHRGMSVSGSDYQESMTTRELIRSGIPVFIGEDPDLVVASDIVIYSSAIPENHVETGLGIWVGFNVDKHNSRSRDLKRMVQFYHESHIFSDRCAGPKPSGMDHGQ